MYTQSKVPVAGRNGMKEKKTLQSQESERSEQIKKSFCSYACAAPVGLGRL